MKKKRLSDALSGLVGISQLSVEGQSKVATDVRQCVSHPFSETAKVVWTSTMLYPYLIVDVKKSGSKTGRQNSSRAFFMRT